MKRHVGEFDGIDLPIFYIFLEIMVAKDGDGNVKAISSSLKIQSRLQSQHMACENNHTYGLSHNQIRYSRYMCELRHPFTSGTSAKI
jgi:hypothetical protein